MKKGLPADAAPFLHFERRTRGPLPTLRQWFDDEGMPDGFRVIGTDGGGDPICVREGNEGARVVLVDHAAPGHRPQVMNSSVTALQRCLAEYSTAMRTPLDESSLRTLRRSLRTIDAVVANTGSFWAQQLASVAGELREKRLSTVDAQGLVRALASRRLRDRQVAAQRLARLERPDATALPALAKALSDEAFQVRIPAAEALRRYGANALPVKRQLIAALQDEYVQVSLAAVDTLVALQGAAKPALPKLEALLERLTYEDSRIPVREAISRIRKASSVSAR